MTRRGAAFPCRHVAPLGLGVGADLHRSEQILPVLQLNMLVRQIERSQPFESRLLELEELLEHFVERAIVLEQCRSLVQRAGPLAPNDPAVGQSPMRTELVRRRIELREACERRAIGLDAELEAVIEFVRLVALKAACPAEGSDDDDVLEGRLREMDGMEEAAIRQLAGLRATSPGLQDEWPG